MVCREGCRCVCYLQDAGLHGYLQDVELRVYLQNMGAHSSLQCTVARGYLEDAGILEHKGAHISYVMPEYMLTYKMKGCMVTYGKQGCVLIFQVYVFSYGIQGAHGYFCDWDTNYWFQKN